MKKNISIIVLLLGVLLFLVWFEKNRGVENNNQNSLEKLNSGDSLQKNVVENSNISEYIRVSNIKPGDTVTKSPVKVIGEARGSWFFEAVFPVYLEDENGKMLGQSQAKAKGEWMTENFVPFEAEVKIGEPDTETGYVVLQKDNPSGKPELESELKIPVKFSSYNK